MFAEIHKKNCGCLRQSSGGGYCCRTRAELPPSHRRCVSWTQRSQELIKHIYCETTSEDDYSAALPLSKDASHADLIYCFLGVYLRAIIVKRNFESLELLHVPSPSLSKPTRSFAPCPVLSPLNFSLKGEHSPYLERYACPANLQSALDKRL